MDKVRHTSRFSFWSVDDFSSLDYVFIVCVPWFVYCHLVLVDKANPFLWTAELRKRPESQLA
jgi:hypothetical protein